MLRGLNAGLRRQRRRVALVAAMLVLAGTVVIAHGGLAGHMGDGIVMCLAVVETAMAAIAAAVLLPVVSWRVAWPRPRIAAPHLFPTVALVTMPARAGPAVLQVFRL